MQSEVITFSFGKNWRSFVDQMSQDAVTHARRDIEEWLGAESIAGKTVLDIGSGSGIHSLCYFLLGAKEIVSVDVDPHSVEATRQLWRNAGSPENWRVIHGSILDREFTGTLGKHDIVYSWGVLHHTGAMWEAMANACSRVEQGGRFWIAIYVKGPSYPQHLALKQKYNRSSLLGKKMMIWKYILGLMRNRWKAGKNPFGWNETYYRGMDVYHDIVDWYGGLPYEVASKEEVVDFCEGRGFSVMRIDELGEGANNMYLFCLSPQSS
jgi:SAM-dependent methyltransferase